MIIQECSSYSNQPTLKFWPFIFITISKWTIICFMQALAEWVVFTCSGISSGLYHACDVGTWCALTYNVLQVWVIPAPFFFFMELQFITGVGCMKICSLVVQTWANHIKIEDTMGFILVWKTQWTTRVIKGFEIIWRQWQCTFAWGAWNKTGL